MWGETALEGRSCAGGEGDGQKDIFPTTGKQGGQTQTHSPASPTAPSSPHHPNAAPRAAQPSMVPDPFPGSHIMGSASPCQSHPSGRPRPELAPQGQQSQPRAPLHCRATASTQGPPSFKRHRSPSQRILTACSMSASTYELSQGRPGCRRAPSSARARAPSSAGS